MLSVNGGDNFFFVRAINLNCISSKEVIPALLRARMLADHEPKRSQDN
jgi:hypothetical protein